MEMGWEQEKYFRKLSEINRNTSKLFSGYFFYDRIENKNQHMEYEDEGNGSLWKLRGGI